MKRYYAVSTINSFLTRAPPSWIDVLRVIFVSIVRKKSLYFGDGSRIGQMVWLDLEIMNCSTNPVSMKFLENFDFDVE